MLIGYPRASTNDQETATQVAHTNVSTMIETCAGEPEREHHGLLPQGFSPKVGFGSGQGILEHANQVSKLERFPDKVVDRDLAK
jgi:hypothetical protein